jgi:hypothetical protein
MNRKLLLFRPGIFGLCVVLGTIGLFAQETAKTPLLVLDAKPASQKEPYFFRTSKDPIKEAPGATPSRGGLDTLNASGSASFSEESLQKMLKKIPAKKITVVDLRQESHGFLNGLAIEWWESRNAANRGKSLDQIIKDETDRLAALKQDNKATIERLEIDDQKKTFDKKEPIKLPVQSVKSEQEVCKAYDLGYVRIPVIDRERPDDAQVDRFVAFVRELPDGQWLHFHCKAGHGRTTMFLAMYDMMRHAKKVSLDDIIKRQFLIGGIDLAADPDKDSWRYALAVERRKFLGKFYQYCKENNDGFKQSWTQWLEKQGMGQPSKTARGLVVCQAASGRRFYSTSRLPR